MKYIIEIEDEPYFSGGKTVYRMSGAHVYFSEVQFEKLTPYVESDTAEQAWELACHLYNISPDVTEAIYRSMNGGKGLGVALEMSYAEAKAEYVAWQKKRDKINVGDEVAFHHDDGRPDTVIVVTFIGEISGFIDGMDAKGTLYASKNPAKWTKTGRHFPEIADLLEKMRNPDADH